MTNSTETERAELIAERAELVAKNEAATSWGAAVGARHERIVEIDRQLRRLAAQDQKPVAWRVKAVVKLLEKHGYRESWVYDAIKAFRTTPAATKSADAGGGVNVSRDMLLTLISVLDCALGDTYPSIDQDYTDDEVKRDYPVFWVCQQLSALSHQPLAADSNASAEAECTDCGGTGVTYQTERPCSCNASAEARLREALEMSGDAIDEYYRYWTGGETRGSYDGRPERDNLWKAMYAVRDARKALSPNLHASEETTKSDETGIRVEDNHRSHGASLQQGPDTSSNPSTAGSPQGKGLDAASVANPVATSDRASHVAPVSLDPHASDCEKQKECCDLAAKEPCPDCPLSAPSDRHADVTAEDLSKSICREIPICIHSIIGDVLARALLRSFTVGRR